VLGTIRPNVLGFASIDHTAVELACIHLGAVVVPLQTSAPAAQHAPEPLRVSRFVANHDGLNQSLDLINRQW